MRKGLAVVTVAIFIGIALTPVVTTQNLSLLKTGGQANHANNNEAQEELVKVEVTQYSHDGLTEKRIVTLPQNEVNKLRERLIDTKTTEERFCILKEYGLILKERSLESWKEGMYRKAEGMGLREYEVQNLTSKYERMGISNLPVLLSFFCKVNAIYVLSGDVNLGFLPIIGLNKFFGSLRVLTFDLVDVCWGAFGMLETKGLLRNHALIGVASFMAMAGFVGIHVHIPLVIDVYNGFSAMTFAAGLGMHSINFNLATVGLLSFVMGGLLMQGFSDFSEDDTP
jgi:hypothetical protein